MEPLKSGSTNDLFEYAKKMASYLPDSATQATAVFNGLQFGIALGVVLQRDGGTIIAKRLLTAQHIHVENPTEETQRLVERMAGYYLEDAEKLLALILTGTTEGVPSGQLPA